MSRLSPLLRLFVLLWCCGVAVPAWSVTNTLLGSESAPVSAVDLGTMSDEADVLDAVSRLSDAQVRAVLLERMDAVAIAATAQSSTGDSLVALLTRSLDGVQQTLLRAIIQIPSTIEWQWHAFNVFASTRPGWGIARFFAVIAAAVLAGLAAEQLVGALVRRWRALINLERRPDGLFDAVRMLALRLVFDVVALLAFFYVTRQVAVNFAATQDGALTRLFLLNFVVLPRAARALARFVLAPNHPTVRLLNVPDDIAHQIANRFVIWIMLIGLSDFAYNFNRTNSVPFDENLLPFWLNLVIHVYLGWAVWNMRRSVPDMLLGRDGDNTAVERWVANSYATFAVALVPLSWLLVEILIVNDQLHLVVDDRVLIFVGLVMSVPLFDTAIRGTVGALLGDFSGDGQIAEQAFKSTRRSYIRIGRLIGFAVFLVITVPLFDLDMATMSGTGLIGGLLNSLIDVLMIIAVGYLIWELVTLAINRKLAAEHTAAGNAAEAEFGGEGGGAGVSRLATILPLLRITLQTLIVSITVLVALNEMAVDITPLLAGAGVVGLAVGFGAQRLVADVVSGVFFLVDDAFRAGEYVDIEGTVGTVESISLRSMQLRHHRGAIHTIPYGEIPRITNYSRDWVIMKLRFTVPFDTNLNTVKKLFKQIGRDMMEVPEFAEDFIQPFKSQGALEVDDVGIVVRGKFMAKPGKQFTLRKEILARVQRAFDENGIQFARKEVRVRIDGEEAAAGAQQPTGGPAV
ncbi:MAG: mechanosensitive ion channel family protein [Pseudomonadota bacterium]